MASSKKSVVTAFVSALFSAAFFITSAFAATPVAVWDGDFTTMTKGSYTLSENGNTKTDNYLQISGDNGILLTSSEALNVFTVIVRCEGLNLSAANGQVLFTSYGPEASSAIGIHDNMTGVYLPANNAVCRGIWQGGDWNSGATQGSVPANYTTLIYNHQQSNGTYAYALGPTSNEDKTVVRTTLYSVVGLRSSGTTYKGFAIGGLRGTTSATLLPATGLKITSLAVFSGTLSEADMKAYAFPTETQEISIDNDTTVSAINLQAGVANGVVLTVADGVTITCDTNFSASSVKLISNGSITLSAKAPPGSAELAKFDCSGVTGALIRTWLNPRVVGYNFRNNSGGDTEGQLATGGTWFINANSANGTDTGLFADGLTKLTWTASGTYASGVGSSITAGYLDDNSSQSPAITLSAIPYETYDVVIYCSTDSDNFKFSAKEVNGNLYTWNGSETVTTEDENAAWGQSKSATIVEGTNALRVNGLSGTLTIKGGKYSNTTALKCRSCIAAIQIMPAGVSSGKSELLVDATEGLTLSSDALALVRACTGTVRVCGSGEHGAVMDYGHSTDSFSSHIVFDGGKHILKYKGNAETVNLGANSTAPIFEVSNGAEVDFYQHDLTGWSGAQIVSTTDIRIDAGAVMNLYPYGSGTTYYRGRYTLEPGATLTSYFSEEVYDYSTFRMHGGAVQGSEQIYVPASAAPGSASAVIDGAAASNGKLHIHNDATVGFGIFVGENSTLDIDLGITSYDSNAPIGKWGDGTLNLNGDLSGYKGTFAIHEGTVFVSTATTLGSVTVDEGATLAYSYDAKPTIAFGSVAGTIAVDVSSLVSGGVIKSGTYQIAPAGIPSYCVVVTGLPENSGFSVSATVDGGIVLSDEYIFSPEWTGASGTWSATQFNGKTGSTDGLDVSFSQGTPPLSEVTVAVDGEKSVNSASFVAKDTEYTLTGDKISAANGVVVGSVAPVTIYNAIDGAVAINAGSELTLAGEDAALQNGQLSGSGTLVLDPGNGKTYTMSAGNTSFTGEAVIASGTVKMGGKDAFGANGRASSIRVKGGATLDENGLASDSAYQVEKNKVILEKGATFTSSISPSDLKQVLFTSMTLEGNALVDASAGTVAMAYMYNYYYTSVNLGTNTLEKIGNNDFYLSATQITGTGKLHVKGGSLTVSPSYYDNALNSSCAEGTMTFDSGTSFILLNYFNNNPIYFSVKNLELNGMIDRQVPASTLTVTGYITGRGTTPMLTLAEGAVFKPTGNGYLRVTESLTVEGGTMTIDISEIDFASRTSVPLFRVGSAEMLPEPSQITIDGDLPEGWELAKLPSGLGYKLRKPIGLIFGLR